MVGRVRHDLTACLLLVRVLDQLNRFVEIE
jgi:hypothetical protein